MLLLIVCTLVTVAVYFNHSLRENLNQTFEIIGSKYIDTQSDAKILRVLYTSGKHGFLVCSLISARFS